MTRFALALVLLLALAGCAPKGSSQGGYAPQPFDILAVPQPPVTWVPPELAIKGPLTIGILSGNHQVANVGSYCALPLEVMVLDGDGKPVPYAYVTFAPERQGQFFGLGTASTDTRGVAGVMAGPAGPGVAYARAFAVTTYLYTSNGVSFTVTGVR